MYSEGKSQTAALPQVLPVVNGQFPRGGLTSSRIHTISLTLFYFLLARECWKSSLSWTVTVRTMHTLERAWPPSATSMMMAFQVGAIFSWAISLEMPPGLVALPVSRMAGCCVASIAPLDLTSTWACTKYKWAHAAFVC